MAVKEMRPEGHEAEQSCEAPVTRTHRSPTVMAGPGMKSVDEAGKALFAAVTRAQTFPWLTKMSLFLPHVIVSYGWAALWQLSSRQRLRDGGSYVQLCLQSDHGKYSTNHLTYE